jgi:hypothetical protein
MYLGFMSSPSTSHFLHLIYLNYNVCVCVCVYCDQSLWFLQFTGYHLEYFFLLSAFPWLSSFVTPIVYCRDLMCALFVFCAPLFRCLFLKHEDLTAIFLIYFAVILGVFLGMFYCKLYVSKFLLVIAFTF